MIKNNKKISKEELISRALSYNTRGEFAKGDPSAYQICYKRKILDEICFHMIKKEMRGETHPKYKYTNDDIKNKALACSTKKEFREKYSSEYILAHNRKIIGDITKHMVKSNPAGENHSNSKYKNKELEKLASSCKTLSEFIKKYYNAYIISRNRGIFNKITKHMPKLIGENSPICRYKNDDIIVNGSKYKTKGDFLKSEPSMYARAFRRNLLDKIIFADNEYVNSSSSEIYLFNIVKSIYPKTQKLKDRKVKIKGKPHIQGFELDIYVPELRKAIEFDGKYFHSFGGLKRARPKWADDDIVNYHTLKNSWFASKGIEILHIKEEDWIKNQQDCVNKCLEFFSKERIINEIDV